MTKFRENHCLEMDTPNYQLDLCEAILEEMFIQFGNLNPYALDYPVCIANDKNMKVDSSQEKMW
eukprot:CAMPEP_0174823882 /NCGR_PEP_ID=MMETSP1107-20130205/28422_1 /TAXON_ID=36770 /ORGANISM="Paraphysomonas vestita, Strain GFlagA" /LENGTH=63 /DNA_ID=CAMNT_0016048283 /DNA_START=231 /DNA_END=419 /DNA_ORIENTATION=-